MIRKHPSAYDGWKLDDTGIYEIHRFKGVHVPTALIPDDDKSDENDDSEGEIFICFSDEDGRVLSDDESDIINNNEDSFLTITLPN